MNKAMIRVIAVSVVLALAIAPAHSHKSYPVDDERAVREADVIVIATVLSSKEIKERCETTFVDRLRIDGVLKGSFVTGRELEFVHSIFHWRKAEKPWEKECPSVHFVVPPRVTGVKAGDRVIAVLKKSPHDGALRVSGTIAVAKLAMVKRLVR